MPKNKDNVILFPKWRGILEKESLKALKEKRFVEALEKLNQLIDYGVNHHEIMIGKLMCLMELDRYEDAQQLCESLLKQKDRNYYHYVHIYLTILFQTSQYLELIEQIDTELEKGSIPTELKEQFTQLYDMSKQMQLEMQTEKMTEYIRDLLKAVEEENYTYQWQMVEQLRRAQITPPQKVKTLLADEAIHPVVKTALFFWFQERSVSDNLVIAKLNISETFSPAIVPEMQSHPLMEQVQHGISQIEQDNPSLYQMLRQLLYRYFYVRFPLLPPIKDAGKIADALIAIGETYLDIHSERETGSEVSRYMEEITMCEALYLSVREDS